MVKAVANMFFLVFILFMAQVGLPEKSSSNMCLVQKVWLKIWLVTVFVTYVYEGVVTFYCYRDPRRLLNTQLQAKIFRGNIFTLVFTLIVFGCVIFLDLISLTLLWFPPMTEKRDKPTDEEITLNSFVRIV